MDDASREAARDATRAIDSATAAIERLEGQRLNLAQRLTELEPVLEAAREAAASAGRNLAALADPAMLESAAEVPV